MTDQPQQDLEAYATWLGWTELKKGSGYLFGVPPGEKKRVKVYGKMYNNRRQVPCYDQSLDLIVAEVEKLDIDKLCEWRQHFMKLCDDEELNEDFELFCNAPAHLRLRALVETVVTHD